MLVWRLAAGLTLPQLRGRWAQGRDTGAERSGAFWFTAPERDTVFQHASRQAARAAEHIRRCAYTDPGAAADAAWAAADTLHAAARALCSPALRYAADAYDRAARAPNGRVPRRSREGDRLRAVARLLAMAGDISGDATVQTVVLVVNLATLAAEVSELRQAQQHAAQAAAARTAAQHLHDAMTQAHSLAPRFARGEAPVRGGAARAAQTAPTDVPVPLRLPPVGDLAQGRPDPSPGRARLPPKRAGPARSR